MSLQESYVLQIPYALCTMRKKVRVWKIIHTKETTS